jgi:aspartyl-tRNA(Asn)/glutamyl-tRNA(Gln) amidotransferase subunit C
MSLTAVDIERIANLARLELRTEEVDGMLTKMNGFFQLVEAMQSVPTDGVVPLAHPIEVVQPMVLRLRDDVASEPNAREDNQRSAPAVEKGLFLVPKVIE